MEFHPIAPRDLCYGVFGPHGHSEAQGTDSILPLDHTKVANLIWNHYVIPVLDHKMSVLKTKWHAIHFNLL